MGLPFFKKTDVIGLDIGSNSVKLIHLAPTKKGWKMAKIGLSQLPPEAIVDGSIIDSMTVINAVKGLIAEQGVKIKNTVSALTGHSDIIKKVNLPVMSDAELADSLPGDARRESRASGRSSQLKSPLPRGDTEGRGQ